MICRTVRTPASHRFDLLLHFLFLPRQTFPSESLERIGGQGQGI